MMTTKKITSLLLFFLLVGSASVLAQEKETQEKEEPKVSQAELTKFAGVFEQLQEVNDDVQRRMVILVENEGLDMKRFNEIHVAYINPNMESNATPEELKKHKRIMDEIQNMQASLQDDMDSIVKESGMSIHKYQKIATALQDNMTLRDRYKKLVKVEKVEEE